MGDETAAPPSGADSQVDARKDTMVDDEAITVKSWSNIPADLMERIIIGYIPSRLHRFFVSLVNKHWQHTMKSLELLSKPVLPWLFLPSSESPSFFDPDSMCLHAISGLPDDLRLGYPCGTYPGGWVLFDCTDEDEPEAELTIILFNLVTGKRLQLPATIMNEDGLVHRAGLVMASLSASPSDPDLQIAGVFIYGDDPVEHKVCLWKRDQDDWEEIGAVEGCWEDGIGERVVEDIIFLDGVFLLITRSENLITLDPGLFSMTGRYSNTREDIEEDDDFVEDMNGTLIKYLARSTEGDLLLCVKYVQDETTRRIRIFTYTTGQDAEAWTEHLEAGGDTMYLGRSCSLCYHDGQDAVVHFVDDRQIVSVVDGDVNLFHREDMGGFLPYGQADAQFCYRIPALEPAFMEVSDLFPPIWCTIPLIAPR